MKEIKELTEKEIILVSMLQNATRDKPVTRQILRQTFGNDRKCRDMIANIRKNGYRVVTNFSTGGYWIAKTEKEYREFRPKYVSYALEIQETVEEMDNEGQVGFDV